MLTTLFLNTTTKQNKHNIYFRVKEDPVNSGEIVIFSDNGKNVISFGK